MTVNLRGEQIACDPTDAYTSETMQSNTYGVGDPEARRRMS